MYVAAQSKEVKCCPQHFISGAEVSELRERQTWVFNKREKGQK